MDRDLRIKVRYAGGLCWKDRSWVWESTANWGHIYTYTIRKGVCHIGRKPR